MRTRKRVAGLLLLTGLVMTMLPTTAATGVIQADATYHVLVFAKTGDGAKNPATQAGISAIQALGNQLGFRVEATRDSSHFRSVHRLSRFAAVVFLNTTGDVLNDDEQANFEEYIRAGNGFLGIGSAVETEPDWEFFSDLLGTRATDQASVQTGTIKVADRVHDASKDLPEYWNHTDAWYNFEDNVRGESHVLATVVETVDALGAFAIQPSGETLNGITGGTMGFDHPVTWCKDYVGGRSFYTALGNTAGAFGTADLRSHLGGAISWAAGVSDPVYSDCGATVLGNYQQTKISGPPNLSEPIGFDSFPDGRIIQTDRRGGVRLHDPVTNTSTLIAQLPDIYQHSEDGMYGPAVDNNFAENKWVYLYYSPNTVEDVKLSTGEIVTQTTPAGGAPTTNASVTAWDPFVGYFQLSRFKFVDGDNPTLDISSEEQILRVPVNRGACCHVAGDIDFDVDNNLWLVTGDDTPAGGGNSGGFGPFNDMINAAGLFNAPFVDARRSSLNTNDLRGKILRIDVKDGAITPAEENTLGGAYTVPAGNLFAPGTEKTRPEIYAMGFRNPFRIQVDDEGNAYITDYSPDSNTPAQFRGPAGTGRIMVVREPANYGWPVCYRTDLPYYRWNFNTSQPLDTPPLVHECDNPDQGPQNNSRWNLEGGPTVEPGLEYGPPITNPEVWYSFAPENNAANPRGTPCFAYYGPDAQTTPNCPRLFPEFGTGGVGPHGADVYEYDPDNPNPTKFPPYYDGAIFFGEFTRDMLREIRLDADGNVFKINQLLTCGGVGTPNAAVAGFECDNPMDMQFGADGHFYLLTYGDGFFAINNDAGMYKWEYVKGQRAPRAEIDATPTDGQNPLTVQFSAERSFDPDPGDGISLAWDFDGNGTTDSTDVSPTHTYTVRGQFTARLTVTDTNGLSSQANTTITVGNTTPVVTVNVPAEGGLFAFGQTIPYTVTVTDAEDAVIDCNRVEVTWVLAHDSHGHAQDTYTGCSGVIQTIADDVSHGGNVWGIVSAQYTDNPQPGGVPALTGIAQTNVRQKRQQVEFVLEQQGTNVGANTDDDGGQHRGSLGNGDWIKLNGPINQLNIQDIAFRTSAGSGASGTGLVELRLGAPDGPIHASFTIQPTANANTWVTQTFPVTDPGGPQDLYLVFRPVTGGPGNNFFNLNWVEFLGQGVAGS